jgi:hypothetical protein
MAIGEGARGGVSAEKVAKRGAKLSEKGMTPEQVAEELTREADLKAKTKAFRRKAREEKGGTFAERQAEARASRGVEALQSNLAERRTARARGKATLLELLAKQVAGDPSVAPLKTGGKGKEVKPRLGGALAVPEKAKEFPGTGKTTGEGGGGKPMGTFTFRDHKVGNLPAKRTLFRGDTPLTSNPENVEALTEALAEAKALGNPDLIYDVANRLSKAESKRRKKEGTAKTYVKSGKYSAKKGKKEADSDSDDEGPRTTGVAGMGANVRTLAVGGRK